MNDIVTADSQGHTSNWSETDWFDLIETIHNDRCVLMLGPDIAIPDGNDIPLSWKLANQFAGLLEEELAPKEFKRVNQNNLPHVTQLYAHSQGDNRPRIIAKSFFEQHKEATSELHKNLAVLPFRTVITSSHDEMLVSAYSGIERPKKPKIQWYHFNGNEQEMVPDGSEQSPLVYYLYGHPQAPESLVLTENDLLDFLVRVIKGRPALPDNLMSMFDSERKCYLFLGFGFRNWYLRILMHVMQRNKRNRSVALERMQRRRTEFQSTILFFKKSRHKIHIYNMEMTNFTKTLKEKYFEKYRQGADHTSDQTFSPDAPEAFISHTRNDHEIATSLCKALEQYDIKAWIDNKDLMAGDKFDKKIKNAIREKIQYFILLNSAKLESRIETYTMDELEEAMTRQKKFKSGFRFIIPITFDGTKEIDEIDDIHQISLTSPDDITDLVKAIKLDWAKRNGK